jgi:hypothetical protein
MRARDTIAKNGVYVRTPPLIPPQGGRSFRNAFLGVNLVRRDFEYAQDCAHRPVKRSFWPVRSQVQLGNESKGEMTLAGDGVATI